MKETTFEDLIKEKQYDVDNFNVAVPVEDVQTLMEKVNKALIAHISQIAKEDFGVNSAHGFIKHIEKLPNDRIIE